MFHKRISFSLLALLWTSGAGLTSAFAEQPQAPDTMQARLLVCAACHGEKGQGANHDYFPRLAGKPTEYLFNQLKNFHNGQRKYPPMNYLVAYLSDDYLHEIAAYYANQQLPYPAPAQPTVPAKQLSRGQQIVLNGNASRHIPACIQCHGKALTGMLPAIPGLVGLPTNYISAQLGAWRSGTRQATMPDCMYEIATRLTDQDISAIASWLTTQRPSSHPMPAPAAAKLPLPCGSQRQ